MVIKPPRAERLVIPGPAGDIQALIETPADPVDTDEVRAFGVICHPHPLYGGTLDNKVVYALARAFEELGAPAIRFNFRGVGTSEGHYDEGIGETDDALAVVAYGRQRWPRAALWLAGFSFGGAVAIRASGRAQSSSSAESGLPQFQPAGERRDFGSLERLVVAAPAITLVDVQDVVTPSKWLIVQGGADDVVLPDAVLEWAAKRSPAPTVSVLAGAGHFFHGRLSELREAVLTFMRDSAGP
jgi:alpha/beta superfamily hydrolase